MRLMAARTVNLPDRDCDLAYKKIVPLLDLWHTTDLFSNVRGDCSDGR